MCLIALYKLMGIMVVVVDIWNGIRPFKVHDAMVLTT